MSELEQLRSELTDKQREILTEIWRYFKEHEYQHWIPTRFLHQIGGGKSMVLENLKRLGGAIVFEKEELPHRYYQLTFLGVLLTEDGSNYEQLVIKYLEYVSRKCAEDPLYTETTRSEIAADLKLNSEQLSLMYFLVEEGHFYSGSRSRNSDGTEWSVGIPDDVEDFPEELVEYIHKRAMLNYDPIVPIKYYEKQSYRSSKTTKPIETKTLSEKHSVKLFISYRRSDSEGYAGRLYDQLIQTFDDSNVFMDVNGIAPGEDFDKILDQQLAKSNAMLVVIGPTWLSTKDESGIRRLDKADDYVRKEISSALKRNIAIIPLLVGSATMPKQGELPADLTGLASRQAFTLRHDSFSLDTKRLAENIRNNAEKILGKGSGSNKDFEYATGGGFDSAFSAESEGDDSILRLFYASKGGVNTYFSSHLEKDAIVQLIEQADVSGWMKHEAELQPYDFWKAILKAVVASYRLEIPYPTDEQDDTEILQMLLSDIGNLGGRYNAAS